MASRGWQRLDAKVWMWLSISPGHQTSWGRPSEGRGREAASAEAQRGTDGSNSDYPWLVLSWGPGTLFSRLRFVHTRVPHFQPEGSDYQGHGARDHLSDTACLCSSAPSRSFLANSRAVTSRQIHASVSSQDVEIVLWLFLKLWD